MDDLIRRSDVKKIVLAEEKYFGLGKRSLLQTMLNDICSLPSAQLEESEVIRCKDCKWWGYDDDDGVSRVCHAAKHGYMSSNWDISIYRTYKGDFYCADAERRTDE